jgi:membrane protein DedA with SNARE-associated domain
VNQLAAGLALGTLLSEDLTSITAGLLARSGELDLTSAITACAVGVYAGDLLLWIGGRLLGRRLLESRFLARRLDLTALNALSTRIDTNLAAVVIGSRFLPGTRLPVYLAAGIWGRRPFAFAVWSLLAVLIWTPLIVLLTAAYGSAVTSPLLGELGGISQVIVAATLLFAGLKLVTSAIRAH